MAPAGIELQAVKPFHTAPAAEPPASPPPSAGGGSATVAVEAAAEVPSAGRLKLSEEELNENTLHLPLEPRSWGIDPALASLISGLLHRDPTKRLGGVGAGGGAAAVKAHALFANLEWELLRAGALPAPFIPERSLVYAKDEVPPLSEDEDAHAARPAQPPPAHGAAANSAEATNGAEVNGPPQPPPSARTAAASEVQSEAFLQHWDYVSGEAAFADELRELVRKAGDELSGNSN